MSVDKAFTKENLDYYLKELAKEFRKRNGRKMPTEIILIGGAAILVNYGFREMTYDIDAVITASSAMKEAINAVGDRLELPNGWLNTDFKNTASYTPKLSQYSRHYRTYSNILEVRTIQAEYLVAMKLMSGRRYKKDLSDIIGIVREQRNFGAPIEYSQIDKAINDLYGSWEGISDYAVQVLEAALKSEDLEQLFEEQEREEERSKEVVIRIQKDKNQRKTQGSIEEIIKKVLEKQKR
ncbi:MAG: hypothetical protein HFE76_09230 [Firmicutes bacterium]|nr:hypothetical protein [Bacillota bacterium]